MIAPIAERKKTKKLSVIFCNRIFAFDVPRLIRTAISFALARIGERDSAQIYLWHMLLRNFAALAFLMAGVYETMACQLLMPFLVGAASTALAELMYRRKKKGV